MLINKLSFKKIIISVTGVLLLHSPITSVSASYLPSTEIQQLINEALSFGDNPLITVGYIEGGQSTYTVYSPDNHADDTTIYNYEVGSITKTVTGAMVARAVVEGAIQLDDPINQYIHELPQDLEFPTVKQLLTHTSGYPTLIGNDVVLENLRFDLNPYHEVTREMMLEEAIGSIPDSQDHPFEYSNFNAGLLGLVLEAIYQEPYNLLVDDFITNELGLQNTHFYQAPTDLGNNWTWSTDDAYAPAGAIISNIEDMLSYAQIQLEGQANWLQASQKILTKTDHFLANDQSSESTLLINGIAYNWFYDSVNNIFWHDGGTGGYTAYLGFNKDSQVAVIVLSNVPMDIGIPANLIGSQMLIELMNQPE